MIKEKGNKIIKRIVYLIISLAPNVATAVGANDLIGTHIIKPDPTSDLSIADMIAKLVLYTLGFAGAIATVFVIYGGLRYITSNGNSEQIDSAKKILLYAILGLLVIALSYVIVKSVTVVANQII